MLSALRAVVVFVGDVLAAYLLADALYRWLARTAAARAVRAAMAWLGRIPASCPPCGRTPSLCEETCVTGYANRVVRIAFPSLTEEGQPELFVTIKNPKTMPPRDLIATDVTVDENGLPVDQALAARRSSEILARMVIAWRMYDATDWQVDEDGNVLDQKPLPLPATPELVDRLPSEAIIELMGVLQEAINPR